mmetsp:Transcript_33097/g.49965  ORF Transcript_33097/g.49965 Transcript_33097/m.49965 type:complete len:433 (-) Transcript_33097:84-1382(-)|eukprot:CAMPEP_0178903592 /NCGR_PEP_ID=MMETSP0786-20121207/5239_1 /TAXON_ID=186022 /ORGANISM="Thalassionema frauenfeldii, Strain CCMP 1798" /LENGTH=432 /DNA_ID=CAMNT_0020574973 /DNA_START=1 /DNA_END=1299 /DNA_ORIENTATION=-
MAVSVWSKRLEQRLSALADGASKESLQTLSRWITFNRKHALHTLGALKQIMLSENTTNPRLWLYWQLIDQVLMLDKDDGTRFNRTEDLRIMMGEHVVIPTAGCLSEKEILNKVKPLIQQWDTINVFGGPTLTNQVKRAVASAAQSSRKDNKPETQTRNDVDNDSGDELLPPSDDLKTQDNSAEGEMTPIPMESTKVLETENTPDFSTKSDSNTFEKRNTTSNIDTTQVEFDFDKAGIPEGRVEAREFLEPCKAVATLQITRDLRSESTVQMKSWFQSIPNDIREDMKARYEKETQINYGVLPALGDDKVEHYSLGLSREILDLDVEEALENVRSFREIVQKLKSARKRLIHLLIKSRCNFGSNQAAEAFYEVNVQQVKLQKRRELLFDAMDLEGLEPPKQEENEYERELEGFTWFNPDEPAKKRRKVSEVIA